MMHDVTKAPSILERPVYGVSEAAGLLGLRSDRGVRGLMATSVRVCSIRR